MRVTCLSFKVIGTFDAILHKNTNSWFKQILTLEMPLYKVCANVLILLMGVCGVTAPNPCILLTSECYNISIGYRIPKIPSLHFRLDTISLYVKCK